MQILLMCAHAYGSVGFPAKWIDGHHAPERRYAIRNGQVILDNGLAEAILHHDAEELLKNPLYRMPTPAEQEARVGLHQATNVPANMIQESAGESAMPAVVVTGIDQYEQPVSEVVPVDMEAQELEAEYQQAVAPPAKQKRPYHRKK